MITEARCTRYILTDTVKKKKRGYVPHIFENTFISYGMRRVILLNTYYVQVLSFSIYIYIFDLRSYQTVDVELRENDSFSIQSARARFIHSRREKEAIGDK